MGKYIKKISVIAMVLIIDAERIDLPAIRPSKHSLPQCTHSSKGLSLLHFFEEHASI